MTQPTLQQVFGTGATQDANTITIAKADLVAVGLTPAADNNGEQITTAFLLKAKAYLTEANQESNPDQSITIEEGFPSLIQRNGVSYRQNVLTVNLQKLDTQGAIDPDDY